MSLLTMKSACFLPLTVTALLNFGVAVQMMPKTGQSLSNVPSNMISNRLDQYLLNTDSNMPATSADRTLSNGVHKPSNADQTLSNADQSLSDTDQKSSIAIQKMPNTDQTLSNAEPTLSNASEPCIGQPEFCNLSRSAYEQMLLEYVYPQPFEWVLIATHSVVYVIGLVGNALVCTAVYRNHTMRTVTNYFLVNLAAADFFVIFFCLPPTVLWDVTETWFFGEVLCKLLLYFQSVSVTVSVLTLTFISVDRWYAICFPLKFKSTTGRAKTAIGVIWFIALTFNSPDLVVLSVQQPVPLRFDLPYLRQCASTWSERSDLIWHVVRLLFMYTLPLTLMTVAYTQIVRVLWSARGIPGQARTHTLPPAEHCKLASRRKAAKMLVSVVVMFGVCYFPVHLLWILRATVELDQTEAVTCLALLSHVMCYANSAVNPLIYNFMSGKFRREFRRAFCCGAAPHHETLTTLTRLHSKPRSCDVILDRQTYRHSRSSLHSCGYRNACSR